MTIDLNNPHRRFNPLTGEWVLVSPHRTKRPWQGKTEVAEINMKPTYDPKCYLCPGNKRAGDAVNPNYKNTFVFTNDFSALLPNTEIINEDSNPLFQSECVKGVSKVICFSPNHSLTIPRMDIEQIIKIIESWTSEYEELGKQYKWVQIFENKGSIMGCSNPHPHGQIWASSSMPNEPKKEDTNQKKYFLQNRSPMILDYLIMEINKKERIVVENEHWTTLVPFWAAWPFETILIPKRHVSYFNDLNGDERISLADILKRHLTIYDKLFNVSFPYTMGWHGAPFGNENYSHWQLHAHFYPPLLRSATVKKFMVGYEMLAEAQRDITAESAAAKLREFK